MADASRPDRVPQLLVAFDGLSLAVQRQLKGEASLDTSTAEFQEYVQMKLGRRVPVSELSYEEIKRFRATVLREELEYDKISTHPDPTDGRRAAARDKGRDKAVGCEEVKEKEGHALRDTSHEREEPLPRVEMKVPIVKRSARDHASDRPRHRPRQAPRSGDVYTASAALRRGSPLYPRPFAGGADGVDPHLVYRAHEARAESEAARSATPPTMLSPHHDPPSEDLKTSEPAIENSNYQEFVAEFSASERRDYESYLALGYKKVKRMCASQGVPYLSYDDVNTLATKLVLCDRAAETSSKPGVRPAGESFIPSPERMTDADVAAGRESASKPVVTSTAYAEGAVKVAKLSLEIREKTGCSIAEAVAIAMGLSDAAPAAEDPAPAAYTAGKTGVMRTDEIEYPLDKWQGAVDPKSVAGSRKTDEHTHFYIFRVMTSMWSKHFYSARLEKAYQSYLRGGAATFEWNAPSPQISGETDWMKVHFEKVDAGLLEKGYRQFDCTKNDGYESAPLVRGAPEDGKIMGYDVEK